MSEQLAVYRADGRAAALAAVEAAALADSTKVKYSAVLNDFLAQGGALTDRAALAAYAAGLSPSRRGLLKAAVKLYANTMIAELRAVATPDNLAQVDAAIHRFTALQTAVVVRATPGAKFHTWLSRAEVVALLDAARATPGPRGARDVLALALLVGAGLRREEAVALAFADVALQPIRGRLRSVLNVTGKGARRRAVPISDRLAALLDAWAGQVGGPGPALRRVGKSGTIGPGLSAVALFGIVRRYGVAIDKPALAPHDLRRSFAQIGYESGIAVTQISRLLGHASLATTQRYLNLELDLESTVSDFVPL